jgi:hypothetical protein
MKRIPNTLGGGKLVASHYHADFIRRKNIKSSPSNMPPYRVWLFCSIIDVVIHLQGHLYSNRHDSCSTLYTHHSVEWAVGGVGRVRDVHMQVGEDGCKSSPVCVKAPIATLD